MQVTFYLPMTREPEITKWFEEINNSEEAKKISEIRKKYQGYKSFYDISIEYLNGYTKKTSSLSSSTSI